MKVSAAAETPTPQKPLSLMERLAREKGMLTVMAAALYVCVSDETIYREIKSFRLRATRIGGTWRIDPSELADYIRRRTIGVST